MSFDENDLRRALEARSGAPSPGYASRVRQSLAGAGPRPVGGWTAAIAVVLVTLLTATSVGVLVASRHGRPGPIASGPRLTTPSPTLQATSVQLSAPSADVVWALVDYQALFVSTDAGAHWDKRDVPSNPGVRPSVSFINDREGWLLAPGSPATQCDQAGADVWHTRDGAKSWQRLQVAGLGAAQCKETIYFSDAGHGLVTAWDDNHQPSVYWSVDGGTGWKKATLPDPPDFKTLPGGFALRVSWIKNVGGTLYLEAYGAQGAGTPYPDFPNRQYIFVSANFGGTWTWKQKVGSRVLAVLTPSRWLELDATGQLGESVNGGQAVTPFTSDIASNTAVDGAVMVFADPNTGYVISGGRLQRTTDGGLHWTTVVIPGSRPAAPSPSPAPSVTPGYFMPTPVLLDAPTHEVVWAFIPQDKVLFRSTDEGDHWEVRNLPPDSGAAFPNFTFLNDQEGWFLGGSAVGSGVCAGERTMLWHTTDGAETWRPMDSAGISDAQCKENLVFVDRTHAFMTSSEENLLPRVYRSSDGGLTWSATTLADPAGFQSSPNGFAYQAGAVKSFGSTELVSTFGNAFLSNMAGGWVYRSDDGGATWTQVASLGDSPGGIVFLSPSHWLRMQGPSGPVQTGDGGKTWAPFASDYGDAAGVAGDFVFADFQVGYGTVRGSFHRTLDGGAHWMTPATPWMPPA